MRIIGGSLRGSKLDVLDAPGLRPTPDRVRETLFNWLMPVIEGARVSRSFAGTGALGIEALSRGAAAVDFVESDARLVAQLRANLSRLKQTASVHAMSASRFVESTEHHYDIVFIDPPFAENLWESSMEAMEIKSVLSDERGSMSNRRPNGILVRAGDVAIASRRPCRRTAIHALPPRGAIR